MIQIAEVQKALGPSIPVLIMGQASKHRDKDLISKVGGLLGVQSSTELLKKDWAEAQLPGEGSQYQVSRQSITYKQMKSYKTLASCMAEKPCHSQILHCMLHSVLLKLEIL